MATSFFKQKLIHVKSLFTFQIIEKILRQCPKTIHGSTHHNKIKKPCWLQLPISKCLLPYGCRDTNRASFTFIYQKGYFRYKTEKVNHWILHIWINQVPNFSLNRQFWFFVPSLPKKSVSGLKHKKWIAPLNSAYSNLSKYQISA